MSLFKALKREPKFYFDFTESQTIENKKITDPYQLINFIEAENRRLDQDYLKDSVVISKVRNNEGAEVLYARRLELPLPQSTDWDKELKLFFTKKALPFDVALQEGDEQPKKARSWEELSTGEESKTQPSTLVEETPWQDSQHSREEGVREKQEIPPAPVSKEESEIPEEGHEKESLTKPSESTASETAPVAYRKEPEESLADSHPFSSDEAQDVAASSTERLNLFGANSGEPTLDRLLEEARLKSDTVGSTPTASLSTGTNQETAHDFMQGFAFKAKQMILAYLEAENEKIYTEVARQDRRKEIPESVTTLLNAEKREALSTAKQELEAGRKEKIRLEKERHEAALLAIDVAYQNETQNVKTRLESEYDEKIKAEITARFTRETEHLANILEGKKSALAMRQTEMSQGLEQSFKQTLEEMNRNQEKVLTDLSLLQGGGENVIALKKAHKAG